MRNRTASQRASAASAIGAWTAIGTLAAASTAHATIWFVAPCGSDGWAGVSAVCSAPLGPKRTIQAALAVASDGDEIRVLPGLYAGPIDLDGKAVHLRGLAGAASTFITNAANGSVVLCNSGEGADTVLEGLTITGGHATASGGGMLIALASPTVLNCVFEDNTAGTVGGAVAITTGSPHFIGCEFLGNTAANGGGAVSTAFGVPQFDDCTFEQNSAFAGGAIATSNGNPTIRNCTVRFNDATQGGGVHCSHGTPLVEDSLIAWNVAGESGGGIYAIDAQITMNSNDVVNNAAIEWGGGVAAFGGAASLSQVLLEANDADVGAGLSATDADVSIVASIARLNHADASGGGVAVTDSSLLVFGTTINANFGTTVGGLAVTGGNVDVVGCTIADNTCGFACGGVGLSGLTPANANFQLTTISGNEGTIGGGAVLLIESGASFEATQFTGNTAASGGAIADINEATLSVLRVRDCVFSNNQAISDGGAIRLGALVELDAARCEFDSNSASIGDGGAVWCASTTATVVSCELLGNSAAADGGAIRSTGTLRAANCVIAGNVAGDDGGGIYALNEGGSHVANCTITANTAAGDGDGVQAVGTTPLPIANSIVWANGSPQLAGAYVVSHSIVPAGVIGPGCFAQSPKFVSAPTGNYRLLASSPAIDAGLVWLLPSDLADVDDDGDVAELVGIDLDGNPRVATASANAAGCAAAVDLGAYEALVGIAAPPTVLGDLDGDGMVGAADLAIFLGTWGSAGACPLGDLNGDGVVNAADLAILLASWG